MSGLVSVKSTVEDLVKLSQTKESDGINKLLKPIPDVTRVLIVFQNLIILRF